MTPALPSSTCNASLLRGFSRAVVPSAAKRLLAGRALAATRHAALGMGVGRRSVKVLRAPNAAQPSRAALAGRRVAPRPRRGATGRQTHRRYSKLSDAQMGRIGGYFLNAGAILGLAGFMMTDVLLLRSLSICSSMCGIAFNVTRSPKQWNAVAWGVVFASTNTVMIIKLLRERAELKFTPDEIKLFHRHFEPFGVSLVTFNKLMRIAEWHDEPEDSCLVPSGEQLRKVLIVHTGSAVARDASGKVKYTYEGEGHGGVIGGTALADPQVQFKAGGYPHDIISKEPIKWVEWPYVARATPPDATISALTSHMLRSLAELKKLTDADKSVESALMASLFVDLIHGLRRARGQAPESSTSSSTDEEAQSDRYSSRVDSVSGRARSVQA